MLSMDWFCEKCNLQFGKKYVFDLHLSLVHGQKIKVKGVVVFIMQNNLWDELFKDYVNYF